MLYHLYDFQHSALAPFRMMGDLTREMLTHPLVPASYTELGKSIVAGIDVMESATRQRDKPEWMIDEVETDEGRLAVTRQVVADLPFCQLLHFQRPERRRQDPKVLLVEPVSGHHATLLRGTVETLLQDHEVYVTDWVDARSVPFAEGTFALDNYIDYLLAFMRQLGPDLHVIAVCQPAPLVLSAVALLSAGGEAAAAPRSMTLMGGPVDTRAAATQVTRFAESRPLSWFERSVVTEVPSYYPGAGRKVYPGFLQLSGFISMNASRHLDAHLKMFRHLVEGDGESAAAHRAFYDEYLAVMDIPARFYLETIEAIFQEHYLPKGELIWRGTPVEPAAVATTALMTVEGERDDISAPGQTLAAHGLCFNLPANKRRHYLQPGVGHYGIFNGRRWREEIKPRIARFIRDHERA
jgi:poly(3-hydroxybutyrate) depolymerase